MILVPAGHISHHHKQPTAISDLWETHHHCQQSHNLSQHVNLMSLTPTGAVAKHYC